MKNRLDEAIQLFDGGDHRSFNEIYAGQEDLFENVDDLIDPRMRKLFESTYQTGNVQQKRIQLREAEVKYGGNQWCSELENDNDGVPDGHNRPGIGGSDPQVRQSRPRYHTNAKLGEADEGGEQPEGQELSEARKGKITDKKQPVCKKCGGKKDVSGKCKCNKMEESFARIFEEAGGVPGGHWDSGKGNPAPKNDGVPAGHNSSPMGGSDPQTTMGQGRGSSSNASFFKEPKSGNSQNIHESKLRESVYADDPEELVQALADAWSSGPMEDDKSKIRSLIRRSNGSGVRGISDWEDAERVWEDFCDFAWEYIDDNDMDGDAGDAEDIARAFVKRDY